MNADELDTLARTIYGEARGEGHAGRVAVAWTILNRVMAKSWYGDSIIEVCRKPWQYSCWNDDDPNLSKLTSVNLNDQDFQRCMLAALQVAVGYESDPTGGATHYHTLSVSPSWAEGKSPICTIGRHKFYLAKDIDG